MRTNISIDTVGLDMILILGDTDEDLAHFANTVDPQAVLVSDYLSKSLQPSCIYGSIGDTNLDTIIDLLFKADRIIYHQKKSNWSCDELQQLTENLLYHFHVHVSQNKVEGLQFDQIKINYNQGYEFYSESNNSIKNILKKFNFENFLGLRDYRRTHGQQIWISGCSFAHGVALQNQNQRYGQLIADYFNLPVSFLTLGGTSIDWACDQILRSDIKSNDIVIWGITGINRASWFDQTGKYFNLSLNYLAETQSYETRRSTTEEKMVLFRFICDDARYWLAIRHILQVKSRCESVGAHLILVSHQELSKHEHSELLSQFLNEIDFYVDLGSMSKSWVVPEKFDTNIIDKLFPFRHRKFKDGSDNLQYYQDLGDDSMHPGPATHQDWASKIIDYIKMKKLVK